jgi:two-component system, repressor protein LuxO
MQQPSVLIVDDDELLARAYENFLEVLDCDIELAFTGQEAYSRVAARKPDVILLDLLLPDCNGQEILEQIHSRYAAVDIVIITTESSAEPALQAIKSGACDYLVKPLGRERLVTTVRNLLERRCLTTRVRELEALLPSEGFGGLVGNSPKMQVVYQIIENAAHSDANVFITGESGTGKELCAQAIHNRSMRANMPFVPINCAAIPTDLMESELFGHVKGAFTGAVNDRVGAVQRAEGGTLMLDEVCELPLELQPKLLRLLQNRRYQKVGGEKEESVDTRFICATNRDPLAEVNAGRFREDLFYRLFVLPIELPPLRERREDIEPLLRHLVLKHGVPGKDPLCLSQQAMAAVMNYHWPGNVRQLENLLQNLIATHHAGEVELSEVEGHLHRVKGGNSGGDSDPGSGVEKEGGIRPLWEQEREIIEQAIAACGGNIPEAARQLGINDSTIYRKRKKWREM